MDNNGRKVVVGDTIQIISTTEIRKVNDLVSMTTIELDDGTWIDPRRVVVD